MQNGSRLSIELSDSWGFALSWCYSVRPPSGSKESGEIEALLPLQSWSPVVTGEQRAVHIQVREAGTNAGAGFVILILKVFRNVPVVMAGCRKFV